jgi:hypothetical protein
MKAIINYFHVQCGTCGSGLKGEKAWLEAPASVVECINPDCPETGKQYKLPIQRIELEPFVMREVPPNTPEQNAEIKASLPGGEIPDRWL